MANTTIGTIELVATIDTSKYRQGANEIDRANRDMEGSTGKADSKLGMLAKRGLKTATLGVLALGTAVAGMTIRGGISRALNIEDAQAKLRGLGHDANSVKTIMESALSSVKGTAYGLDAAATAAASAVAAGVKPGQELTRYLSLAGDAATIAGVSFEEMGSIFGKVQTQQRAYTMEINQLADRGIPIYQWLQEELGVTQEALRDMVAAGEVDSATYFKVIEKNIGGAALESGKTARGAWNNMLAALSRVGEKIVTGPIGDIRNGMGDLTKWIDKNSDTIVSVVNKTARTTVSALKTIASILRTLAPIIMIGTAAWVSYRTVVIATNTVMKLQALYAAATRTQYVLLNGQLIALKTATVAQTVAQTALNLAMKANPVGLAIAGAVGLATAVFALTQQTNSTTGATERLRLAREAAKTATDNLKLAEDALKGAQLGAEGAALAVERAQLNYNEALRQYGPQSLEAREAAYNLKRANDDLARANLEVAERTKEAMNAEVEKNKKVKEVELANNAVATSAHNAAAGYSAWAANIERVKEAERKAGRSGSNSSRAVIDATIFGGDPLSGRAMGGPVRANTPYLVGENRDGSINDTTELFVPKTSGRIINSNDLQSMIGKDSSAGITNYIDTINVAKEVDADRLIERLTNIQNVASKGMAT